MFLCKQFGPKMSVLILIQSVWHSESVPKGSFFKKVSRLQKIKKNYPACRVNSTGKGLIKRYKTINSMQLSYSVNAIIWQTVYGDIGSTEIAVSDKVWQLNQETAYISRTFWGNWSNQIWPNKCPCSFKYIWASTRENLSSMVCE